MRNVFRKKNKFILIILTFLSLSSFAQSKVSRFSAGAMLMIGTGKMGNGLTDAVDRDMLFTPVDLFLAFNIKKFRLGVNYEYMIAGQTVEPGTIGDGQIGGTNLSGTGTSPGVRLEYYDGKNSFGLVYRLSDTYNLDKITFAGSKATYKGTGGISVQFTRQLKNKIGFVIDYTTETFSDSLSTGNIKWSRIGAGIVFSNFAGK